MPAAQAPCPNCGEVNTTYVSGASDRDLQVAA